MNLSFENMERFPYIVNILEPSEKHGVGAACLGHVRPFFQCIRMIYMQNDYYNYSICESSYTIGNCPTCPWHVLMIISISTA